MKNDQRCGTCRFWDPIEKHIDWAEPNPKGWCLRFPPMPAAEDPEGYYTLGDWPGTRSAQWCGEWAAADAGEEEAQ